MKQTSCSECDKPLFDQKFDGGELCDDCFKELVGSCGHQCSGSCRRNGCNCVCGEFHIEMAELNAIKK